jgi:peptidyl-prolyl cis-trans isomerase A (cyclophilin A)
MACIAQEAAAPAAPAAPASEAAPAPAPKTVGVVMKTTMGDIHVALEVERAPITANNFLRYVDGKRFDGITFYRALKVTEDGKYGLVQGGLSDPKRVFKPIAHESPSKTGLSHLDGAISMARGEPGTAVADFFFIVGNLSTMDGKPDGSDPGYAVFGHVTEGMDVIHAMLDLPRSAEARNPVMKGQMLAQPVKILTVRREP